MIYNIYNKKKEEENKCLYKREICDGDDNNDRIIR
jgi:hypothetical protein